LLGIERLANPTPSSPVTIIVEFEKKSCWDDEEVNIFNIISLKGGEH